jgi:outer membrane immunogenic protein
MNRLIAAASVALALVAGSAFAADLPSQKGAPVYVPQPSSFSWTGPYGGVNIGYGFGDNDSQNGFQILLDPSYNSPTPQSCVPVALIYGTCAWSPRSYGAAWSQPNNLNGVIGGGQIGYNYQFSPWVVVGLEADIQGSALVSRAAGLSLPPPDAVLGSQFTALGSHQSVDWFGTVRGRIGATPFDPRALLYATGGLAYGGVGLGVSQVNMASGGLLGGGASILGSAALNQTKTGWTAGGGVEWAFLPGWSVKVEYFYVDLGDTTLSTSAMGVRGAAPFTTTGPAFAATQTSSTRFHTVRAGLNWHFNPFSPTTPIVGKN